MAGFVDDEHGELLGFVDGVVENWVEPAATAGGPNLWDIKTYRMSIAPLQ